jgi:uncharacterized Fe-S center protein
MMRVDVENCTGCGVCLDVCPNGAIFLVGGKATIDIASCLSCRTCEEAVLRTVGQGATCAWWLSSAVIMTALLWCNVIPEKQAFENLLMHIDTPSRSSARGSS